MVFLHLTLPHVYNIEKIWTFNTVFIYKTNVSDDEVLLWNLLDSNNYYFALQLPSELIEYNKTIYIYIYALSKGWDTSTECVLASVRVGRGRLSWIPRIRFSCHVRWDRRPSSLPQNFYPLLGIKAFLEPPCVGGVYGLAPGSNNKKGFFPHSYVRGSLYWYLHISLVVNMKVKQYLYFKIFFIWCLNKIMENTM